MVEYTSKSASMFEVEADDSEIALTRLKLGLYRYCKFIGRVFYTN